jgi:ubiquinone/menaquinone biosynthesis C-methylase UbiE
MKTVNEVSLLFDDKARLWNDKYRPNGPLAFRVTVFSAILASLVRQGATVLDFGGGTGAVSDALASQGYKTTVCDISEQMILAGRRIHSYKPIEWVLLREDWKRLPFADNMFDAVIASSVFEYLSDVENTMKECRRVLKPAGKLIFSVPNLAHPLRKLERLLRPLATFGLRVSFARDLPRIGNYLAYLQLSRMRLSSEEWKERARAVGLDSTTVQIPQTESAAGKAMIYLVFDRSL